MVCKSAVCLSARLTRLQTALDGFFRTIVIRKPSTHRLVAFSYFRTMTERIEIYDTTLRDGAQGEGVNFSVADKCRIAEHLDVLGFDFIEGGWPGSNPRDIVFFEQARNLKLSHARVAAFGATRRKQITCDKDQ